MTQPTDEKQVRIDAQIAEFLKNGYKREDLFITQSGSVIYDPTAAEAAAFKGFEKTTDDKNS
jgi:hypothetical protein